MKLMVVVALILAISLPASAAVWETVGLAKATAPVSVDNDIFIIDTIPAIALQVTTRSNPKAIRLVVSGGPAYKRSEISWEMQCESPVKLSFKDGEANPKISNSAPWVKNISIPAKMWNQSPFNCQLLVFAAGVPGSKRIKVEIQAKY